jgi:hypothetical protein
LPVFWIAQRQALVVGIAKLKPLPVPQFRWTGWAIKNKTDFIIGMSYKLWLAMLLDG